MIFPLWWNEEIEEAWQGWLAMRKGLRCPVNTERASKLALRKLEALRWQGYEPVEVLDQSTLHSWRGLFDIKGQEPVLRDNQGRAYRIHPLEKMRVYLQ